MLLLHDSGGRIRQAARSVSGCSACRHGSPLCFRYLNSARCA